MHFSIMRLLLITAKFALLCTTYARPALAPPEPSENPVPAGPVGLAGMSYGMLGNSFPQQQAAPDAVPPAPSKRRKARRPDNPPSRTFKFITKLSTEPRSRLKSACPTCHRRKVGCQRGDRQCEIPCANCQNNPNATCDGSRLDCQKRGLGSKTRARHANLGIPPLPQPSGIVGEIKLGMPPGSNLLNTSSPEPL